MLTFKRASQVSLEELVDTWNQGFEGYFVEVKMNLSQFVTRGTHENYDWEQSLIGFLGEKPIGLVMNGFRQINGKKVAWNGGTGIAPVHRGKGFGQALMEKNVALYKEQGVEIAILEALSQNERAIKLYQRLGYEITEELFFLHYPEALSSDQLTFQPPSNVYKTRIGVPSEVVKLPFYQHLAAWQTQWPSVKEGRSLLVYDQEDVVGYALYKEVLDLSNRVQSIVLYQCEVNSEKENKEEIMSTMLSHIFQPNQGSCKRLTVNLSNGLAIALLQQAGFIQQAKQVHMKLNM